jgi:hypothetical protein
MRAFNLVEHELLELFTKLLDAPMQAAHIVFNSAINAQAIREMTSSLARLRLNNSDAIKVETLMDGSLKRAYTKRNRLVHGRWQIHLLMAEKVEGQPRKAKAAEWQRFYPPSDPSIYEQIYGKKVNQKVRAAHVFSIKEIQEAAQNAADLSAKIRQLREAIVLQPYIPPQPVF